MYTMRVSQKLRKYEQEDPNRAEEYDNVWKITLEGINKLDDTEEQTNELEDSRVKIIQAKQTKDEKIVLNENNLKDFLDTIKHTNSNKLPETKAKEKWAGNLFEEIKA